MTSSAGSAGRREHVDIEKDARELQALGLNVTHTKHDETSGIFGKVNYLFRTFSEHEALTVTEGSATHSLFLNSADKLGIELLGIYKKEGKEGVLNYLLSKPQKITPDMQKKATDLLVQDAHLGTDTKLRRYAAKALLAGKERFKGEGFIVISKTDKKGYEKLEVFHLSKGAVVGQGAYNTAKLIRQEVFGTNEIGANKYKSKEAIYKFSHRPGGDATDDLPTLTWVIELNGRKVPKGFQKLPKTAGENEQITKFYERTDLKKIHLSPIEAIKVMRGPMQALLECERLGVAHTDIKTANILVGEIAIGVLAAVLADFGKVRIFPDLAKLNSLDRQAMAQKILAQQLGVDARFVHTATSQTYKEAVELQEHLKYILPNLEIIATGGIPPGGLAFFNKKYSEMKAHIAAMQVMQMGKAFGTAVLGSVFEFDCLEYTKQNWLIGVDPLKLQETIYDTFGINTELSNDLFTLLNGMLQTDPKNRIHAKDVYHLYENILRHIYKNSFI